MRLVDHSGVEVLEHGECLRLLAGREVGCLGVVDSGQPLILPVNYLLNGDDIVVRTGAIAHGLAPLGDVAVVPVAEAGAGVVDGADLVVVGGPTTSTA